MSKDGKIDCPECNGKGNKENEYNWSILCQKCHGSGKLDWIENIKGKEPIPSISSVWATSSSVDPNSVMMSNSDGSHSWVEGAANNLACEIDQDILDKIKEEMKEYIDEKIESLIEERFGDDLK